MIADRARQPDLLHRGGEVDDELETRQATVTPRAAPHMSRVET